MTPIYQRHIVREMSGPMDLGHHAMLRFPDAPDEEGSAIISTSPFIRGQVLDEAIERPEARGYQSLKPGAMFRSLKRVPDCSLGKRTDLTRYPARRGFEDLVHDRLDSSRSLRVDGRHISEAALRLVRAEESRACWRARSSGSATADDTTRRGADGM